RYLINQGVASVHVINRTFEHAQELAQKLGAIAIAFEDRWQHLIAADIVISSTSCPHTILSREEAEIICRERGSRPLVIVDIALPRDIDRAVREVPDIVLYDIDDLEQVLKRNAGERQAAAAEAEAMVAAEVQGFRRKLLAERVVPTIIALRSRLDE